MASDPLRPGVNRRRSFFKLLAGLPLLTLFGHGVLAKPEREGEAVPKRGPNYSGTIRIRQKNGTLYYNFVVSQGKVLSGVVAHKGRRGVLYDIVGGWYDREHLMLLMQARGNNLRDKWFAHAHQFRRTEEGFFLQHTLYGYGKTEDPSQVYMCHVIDRMDGSPDDEVEPHEMQ